MKLELLWRNLIWMRIDSVWWQGHVDALFGVIHTVCLCGMTYSMTPTSSKLQCLLPINVRHCKMAINRTMQGMQYYMAGQFTTADGKTSDWKRTQLLKFPRG